MHVVVWRSAELTCATASHQIIEVIERALPEPLTHGPDWLEGLVNYRGAWLPLVNIGALLGQEPSEPRMANRILIVTGALGQLALLVDQVAGSETVEFSDSDEFDSWRASHHSFLGPVATTPSGTIQLVDPKGINSAELTNEGLLER